jgi:hypothetical protein
MRAAPVLVLAAKEESRISVALQNMPAYGIRSGEYRFFQGVLSLRPKLVFPAS